MDYRDEAGDPDGSAVGPNVAGETLSAAEGSPLAEVIEFREPGCGGRPGLDAAEYLGITVHDPKGPKIPYHALTDVRRIAVAASRSVADSSSTRVTDSWSFCGVISRNSAGTPQMLPSSSREVGLIGCPHRCLLNPRPISFSSSMTSLPVLEDTADPDASTPPGAGR